MKVRYDVDANGRQGYIETWVDHLVDEWPDLSYLAPNSKRMRAYQNGEWNSLGVVAYADLWVPTYMGGYQRIGTFISGGVWGIESDSPDEYLSEVEQEQTAELWEILKGMGIQTKEVA